MYKLFFVIGFVVIGLRHQGINLNITNNSSVKQPKIGLVGKWMINSSSHIEKIKKNETEETTVLCNVCSHIIFKADYTGYILGADGNFQPGFNWRIKAEKLILINQDVKHYQIEDGMYHIILKYEPNNISRLQLIDSIKNNSYNLSRIEEVD